MTNWQRVYSTQLAHHAEIVKGVLETHEVPAVVLSKKDSSYLFGFYEVHVAADDAVKALKVIADEINFA